MTPASINNNDSGEVPVSAAKRETAASRDELYEQVLGLADNKSDQTLQYQVKELIDKIMSQSQDFCDYVQLEQSDQDHLAKQLQQERHDCLTKLQQMHLANTTIEFFSCKNELQHLRQISQRMLQLQRVARFQVKDANGCLSAAQCNLQILTQLVGCSSNDEKFKQLPWHLRFVKDLDPLGDNDQDDVGGGAMVDNDGRNIWSDYCSSCDWKIGGYQDRWRCFPCQQVMCRDCYPLFYHRFHARCTTPDSNLGNPVLEHWSPSMRRREAVACNSLSEAVIVLLQEFSNRPCFCPPDTHQWMTYEQVLDRCLRLVSILKSLTESPSQIILCFPAGSMEFYLWDIACILTGLTTIGIPNNPPLPAEDWPMAATHVVCHGETYNKYHETFFPPNVVWLDAKAATEATIEPYDLQLLRTNTSDDDTALYTIFLTSGTTTGKPKPIPFSRKQFRKDNLSWKFSVGKEEVPHCTVSYLPPSWGADRCLVYGSLHGGNRVGFTPPNPSLMEIVDTMDKIHPTIMSIMPTVLQFLCSFDDIDKPTLGGNLRHVSVGSAPVSNAMLREFQEKYGIENVNEGYGTTELGGIASNGFFYPNVVKKVRLRNPDCIVLDDSDDDDDDNTGTSRDDQWLDTKQEGVVGELWIGDVNTGDIVELTSAGRKLLILGRSNNVSSFKLANGKWCSVIDIESEIQKRCSDLFDEVMVWCNHRGMMVLLGSKAPSRACWKGKSEAVLLQEVLQRSNLSLPMRPKAMLLTDEPFPRTVTMKLQRSKVIQKFQDEADRLEPIVDEFYTSQKDDKHQPDAGDIAARILGTTIDRTKSFVENGGDSITAVQWLRELKKQFGPDHVSNWRSLLNDPLDTSQAKELNVEEEVLVSFPPPPKVDESANCILLTGATGFFGQYVLRELVSKDDSTIVVCLVRERSIDKIQECERIRVVTTVPLGLPYRSVIHLAANVNHVLGYHALKEDNVSLTRDLLHLRLAPMVFCSTISTREGKPPFSGGYSQSKWVSEQMVLRSGGSCFWPPLLVWGNHRDWLTRLIQHCLHTGQIPLSSSLGYVAACPVDIAAKDLVTGRPCSVWDLDLSDLFVHVGIEAGLRPTPWEPFMARLRADPKSPAYPILPLLEMTNNTGMIGNRRTLSLELLIIDWERVWPLLVGGGDDEESFAHP